MFILKTYLSLYVLHLTLVTSLDIDIEPNEVSQEYSPIVQIVQGQLRGKLGVTHLSGKNFTQFLQIPYANPPTRFYPPQPVDSWEGTIRDATNYGPKCAQFEEPDIFIGDEDCLHLNIHTPLNFQENFKNFTKLLPVIIFLHGGSFQYGGFWAEYGPEYVMEEEIVFVTLNYRLGALGFLSTGNDNGSHSDLDNVVSGNNGLKDQVMALKFLQQNIEAFGGDRERVILIGESAGAASVSYHLLSPMSKGLFSGAVSLSGSALCPWALSLRPFETFSRLTHLLNCSGEGDGVAENLKCLRDADYRDILRHQSLYKWNLDPIASFGPVIENSTEFGFLTDSPLKLLEEGQIQNPVPWIAGVVKEEGLLLHASRILASPNLTQQLNDDWLRVAPLTFLYDEVVPPQFLDGASDMIRRFYFPNQPISNLSRENLAQLYSDRFFIFPIKKAAKLYAQQGIPTYLYLFEYAGEYSGVDPTPGNPWQIVSHGDDTQYILHVKFRPDFPPNSVSSQFVQKYNGLWASFAATLKPTGTWGPSTDWPQIDGSQPENLTWYRINVQTDLVHDPFAGRMDFWESIPIFN